MAAEKLGVVFGLFITIIVGVILASIIGDEVFLTGNTLQVTNFSVDISSARLIDNNVDPGVAFTLTINTGQEIISVDEVRFDNGTVLTQSTDWDTNASDVVFFLNSSLMIAHPDNDTDVDYTFEPSQFVSDSTSRVFLSLTVLLFIIGLLLFVISKLKDFGLFDSFNK